MRLPSTHRYRSISHNEFRYLSRNLEEYQETGTIRVCDALHAQILSRLTGFKVRRMGDGPSDYGNGILPEPLGASDFVLLFQPLSSDMYISIAYARADKFRFEEMVETGVIEPRDSRAKEPVRVRSIADDIVALNLRIAEAEKLITTESTSGPTISDRNEYLKKLLENYKEQKQKKLQDEAVSNIDKVVEIVQIYMTRKSAAEREKNELALKLEIERSVDYNSDEQKLLSENYKILEHKIRTCDEAIASLKALLAEL
jgi:hypothetical protein